MQRLLSGFIRDTEEQRKPKQGRQREPAEPREAHER